MGTNTNYSKILCLKNVSKWIKNTKIEEAFCDFLADKDNQFERIFDLVGTLQTATTISMVYISFLWVKTIVPLFLRHNIVLTADVDSLLKA